MPKFKGVPVEEKRRALLRLKDLLKFGMPPSYPGVRLEALDKTKNDLDGLSGAGLDVFGDALDAVMAAYTVMIWTRDPGLCEVVGDLKGGLILMPKSPRAR